jgi:signal transduction histidine kinase
MSSQSLIAQLRVRITTLEQENNSLAARCERLTQQVEVAQHSAVAQEQEQTAQKRMAELVKENETLKQTIRKLAEAPELDAFLHNVMSAAADQVGACSSELFLYDPPSHTLSMQAYVVNGQPVDIATDDRMEVWRVPTPASITPAWELLISRGESVVYAMDGTETTTWSHGTLWHQQMGHVKIMVSPLLIGDRAIGLIGFCFDRPVTIAAEQMELAQVLANQATLAIQLNRLAEQVGQSAVLEERNHMAREIHDTLAQGFTGIVIQLEAAESVLATPERAQIHLDRARQLARDSLTEARRSVRTLRDAQSHPQTLEADNLASAIAQSIQQITADFEIATHFTLEGTPYLLPSPIEINLLRIAQEAMTNILNHAQANHFTVKLIYSAESIQLQVQDDGQGFDSSLSQADASPDHFGLVGMQERSHSIGGRFSLVSSPGEGTSVSVVVAINSLQSEAAR